MSIRSSHTLPEATALVLASATQALSTTAIGSNVALPNEHFDPPENDPWARCSIQPRAQEQNSLGAIGARVFMRRHEMFIQVFTPLAQGSLEALQILEALVSAFEGFRIGATSIRFVEVSPRDIGADAGWYSVTLSAVFEYYQRK